MPIPLYLRFIGHADFKLHLDLWGNPSEGLPQLNLTMFDFSFYFLSPCVLHVSQVEIMLPEVLIPQQMQYTDETLGTVCNVW